MHRIEMLFKKDISYKKQKNKFVFSEIEFEDIDDNLDKIKNKFKKYTKVYSYLIKIISPVFVARDEAKFINQHIVPDKVCLNVGSGNSDISPYVYNVDIFSYENVNVVCNIVDLPFEDNTIDVVFNSAVLEHTPYPKKVVDEIYRVLKPGGVVYTAFPFMQGFHASPYDFTRVTEEGIKVLHKDFIPIEVKPFGGPTSGMLWILQEWLAICLSFGSRRLHLFVYLLIMCLTFPIKFLDILLIKHPMCKNIASGFIFIGKK